MGYLEEEDEAHGITAFCPSDALSEFYIKMESLRERSFDTYF